MARSNLTPESYLDDISDYGDESFYAQEKPTETGSGEMPDEDMFSIYDDEYLEEFMDLSQMETISNIGQTAQPEETKTPERTMDREDSGKDTSCDQIKPEPPKLTHRSRFMEWSGNYMSQLAGQISEDIAAAESSADI